MESNKKILSLTLTLANQQELGIKGRTIVKGSAGLAYVVTLDETRTAHVESVIANPDIEYVFDGAQLSVNKRKYNFNA